MRKGEGADVSAEGSGEWARPKYARDHGGASALVSARCALLAVRGWMGVW